MAELKLTTWDKIRNGLGFGFSKKTEAALEAESQRQLAIFKEKQAAAIKAAYEASLKSATPPLVTEKKPAAKKPAAKPAAKKPATTTTKKATPKKK